MDIWQELVTAHFPGARRLSEGRSWLLGQLEGPHGGDRRTTLLATSACCDDIVASKVIGGNFWGPFTLGGLGGLPFGGRTAMTAYAHHVPDNGTALVVYGPHIGLTRAGELGRMMRPGQSQETKSCGALLAALTQLATVGDELPDSVAADVDDQQQTFLIRAILPFRSQILNSVTPAKAITDIAYSLIHRQVQHLIALTRSQFHGARIVSVGGVVINTDPDEEDWMEIRDYEAIETLER